ncbi:unsaturated rhamnogalacturonyl hydrolase [Natranaerovirga pectinivora]|uniref:Unsaturated rhamnogalacturonyl hydrolase n=1 Tax=Natranaerovirga pectinivora TaxID=682400 RepID=A0A4R3MJW0_9FIRM|nr:glycoside hydrolase family 88 protein [Natranaerovirga pectinivora]TCT12891.1 unsaturated rhamnogalacturonyl hydrolase [Natranaerovirga pectinivora]
MYTPIQWAEKACETLMKKFEAPNLPPVGRFHYHQGVFLLGVERCWEQNQNDKYFNYIKDWVDSYISDFGSVSGNNTTELDDVQPGIILFNLFEKTNLKKYKNALYEIVPLLKSWKTNSEGGFWHKGKTPNQMWLDGLFMGGPIAVKFGKVFNDSTYFDMVTYQAKLMTEHTKDDKSGLLYHGCDPTKEAEWADPITGRSSEFWGRAIGWYPVAIVDILDYLPKDHKDRDILLQILKDLIDALILYQDKSGLWYQVIDKGENPENWLETSCSSLFVAAIAKAVRMGYLDASYFQYAKIGYKGIIETIKEDENGIIISGICIGTPIGDYDFYITRPTTENDLHGAGAFILMCVEVGKVIT